MSEIVIPVTGPDQLEKMIAAGKELFSFRPWDGEPAENFMDLSAEESEEDDGAPGEE